MKPQYLAYFVALPAILLALSAHAHEPREHMKEAQAPDCAAMKDMDHSKMDMTDQVILAMMQKCMKAMHPDKEDSHEGHTEQGRHDDKTAAKKPAKHQH
ncbi:MAG: hypothetical protein PF589_03530 [Gammaproteobacteria bacterium]|jgi:hypothetical protein|nr:hypothetical protein [Gammaproteobacteria bacterium]